MELLSRLAKQVGSTDLAKRLLMKRGNMNADGSLTYKGHEREQMGAAGRAKDGAAKRTKSRKPTDYRYNPQTNQALSNRIKGQRKRQKLRTK